MTFSELKTQVKALTFPKGEAKNLVSIHDAFIKSALRELQRWVLCFRSKNVDTYSQCSSYWKCGISVFGVPVGYLRILRVYTVNKNTGYCDRVDYKPVDYTTLEYYAAQYAAEYGEPTAPDQPASPALPLGLLYADDSSDTELGRASTGYYAIQDNSIYVWPFIESYENLVVHWDGVKSAYASDTTVTWADDLAIISAIVKYVKFQIASEVTSNEEDRQKFSQEFSTALASLVWECRQRTATRNLSISERTQSTPVPMFGTENNTG